VALAGHATGAERPAARRTVRTALADPEPAVRATALGALDRLGDLQPADVTGAASDPEAVVRVRAAELAHRFGSAGVPTLVAGLSDGRAEVVEASCFGLGEVGEPAAGPAVDSLAHVAGTHPDPLCREAAVAAIGAVGPGGPPSGLAAVLAAMADKPAVRRRAVLALAAFDGPEVEAALEKALEDRDWQVRQAAEDLTGRRR
jgi:HEAT repeat protein